MAGPTPLPPDLAAYMTSLFNRMFARGLTEPVQVWGTQAGTDAATGAKNKRQRVLLGTVQALVEVGGGMTVQHQEAARTTASKECYFPLNAVCADTGKPLSSLLSEAVLPDRWLVRVSTADTRYWTLNSYNSFGPYGYVSMQVGSTADSLGNVR